VPCVGVGEASLSLTEAHCLHTPASYRAAETATVTGRRGMKKAWQQ
jgi:hypothetical protein